MKLLAFALFLPLLGLPAQTPPDDQAAAPPPAENAYPRALNGFALSLHRILAKSEVKENLAFSPTSLSLALAMTSAGASGSTEAEMLKALQLDKMEKPHEAALAFLKSLTPTGPETTFTAAQGIWLKPGLVLAPEFSKTSTDLYQATSEVLDFSDPEKALAHLNGWISDKTQARIPSLFDSKSIKPGTELVLASALYFKSVWTTPFKAELTKSADFKVSKKEMVPASFMHRTGKMDYAETKTLQIVRLPYAGKEWSLVILLPAESSSLAALEDQLDAGFLEKTLSTLTAAKVDLALPKFKAETKLDLRASLQKAGIKLAFGDEADFSRLTEKPGNLKISKVLHQTFVEVNEEGTEAAAATGVIMKPKGVSAEDAPKVFLADRPFLYWIQHEPSGSVVFLGRLTNPAKLAGPSDGP